MTLTVGTSLCRKYMGVAPPGHSTAQQCGKAHQTEQGRAGQHLYTLSAQCGCEEIQFKLDPAYYHCPRSRPFTSKIHFRLPTGAPVQRFWLQTLTLATVLFCSSEGFLISVVADSSLIPSFYEQNKLNIKRFFVVMYNPTWCINWVLIHQFVFHRADAVT